MAVVAELQKLPKIGRIKVQLAPILNSFRIHQNCMFVIEAMESLLMNAIDARPCRVRATIKDSVATEGSPSVFVA